MKRQCPSCNKVVALTVRGSFRNHRAKTGASCDMGETPSNETMAPDRPLVDGHYWVRGVVPCPERWTVALWSDERWSHVGNDQEYAPDESQIREWRGPLKPPSD